MLCTYFIGTYQTLVKKRKILKMSQNKTKKQMGNKNCYTKKTLETYTKFAIKNLNIKSSLVFGIISKL